MTALGAVTAVWEETRSTLLTTDANPGDTVLFVESTAGFTTGDLILDDFVLTVVDLDDTTLILDPATPVPATGPYEAPFPVYNAVRAQAETQVYADLTFPTGGTVVALVVTAMEGYLPAGDYRNPVDVAAELVDGQWEVTRLVGQSGTFVGEVQVTDEDGGVAGGVDSSGNVAAGDLSYGGVFNALGPSAMFDGIAFSDWLSLLPRGIQAWGSHVPAVTGITTTEYGLGDVSWRPPADYAARLYRVAGTVQMSTDTADTSVQVAVRYTTDGSAPTISSPVLFTVPATLRVTGTVGAIPVASSALFTPTAGGQHRFLLTVKVTGPSTAKVSTVGSMVVRVEDTGLRQSSALSSNNGGGVLAVGGTDGGGGVTPTAQTYTTTYQATATNWWEDNQTVLGPDGVQYTGFDPYVASMAAAIWFDSARILTDLTGATVTRVRLRLRVKDAAAGGATLVVGTHGDSTVRTVYPSIVGVHPDRARLSGVVAGSTAWVELPSGLSEWATGVSKGIIVGPPPSPAQRFYVGFAGADANYPPALEITYTK